MVCLTDMNFYLNPITTIPTLERPVLRIQVRDPQIHPPHPPKAVEGQVHEMVWAVAVEAFLGACSIS